MELKKLRRRHEIRKWIDLTFGLALILGGFAAIVFQEVRELIPELPAILFSAVGGGIVGTVARNWRGSPELKALERSVS